MPSDPSGVTEPSGVTVPAEATGIVDVPGTPLRLAFRRRGADVELEVEGSVDEGGRRAAARAVADAVRSLAARPALAGAEVHLAADHPAEAVDPLPEEVADAAGLPHRRDLLQLRRPLPVPADHPARDGAPALAVRPFRPGADDAAWLEVNNAAFAHHPDQGRETPTTLASRAAEPWFDPAGFLVADDPDRPGALAGFCWTKVHPAAGDEPALGEIYVIGVHPSRHGAGLGAALVLAGLDHLAGLGLGDAMLYVDADNLPARRLYTGLGFAIARRRRVYSR
jgi:mycothiol synthase